MWSNYLGDAALEYWGIGVGLAPQGAGQAQKFCFSSLCGRRGWGDLWPVGMCCSRREFLTNYSQVLSVAFESVLWLWVALGDLYPNYGVTKVAKNRRLPSLRLALSSSTESRQPPPHLTLSKSSLFGSQASVGKNGSAVKEHFQGKFYFSRNLLKLVGNKRASLMIPNYPPPRKPPWQAFRDV